MGAITFRDVAGLEEYEACVGLQRAVWAFPDVEIVPAAHLVVMHHCGGTCIGAFDGEAMVGFACGFVGWVEGRTFHHSHMLAVLPQYRGRRVGEMLKWEQRERILAQGMELINWTYDPLQAPNANFNINRLGVVVGTYLVDLYGSSGSPLHGGIPTDRFEAEWWIGSERVLAAVRGVQPVRSGWEVLPRANRVSPAGPFIRCDGFDDGLDAPEMLVEIPAAISSIMAEDRELALDWRLQSRAIFQRYFGRGYRVVGFHRGEGRAFYRLTVSDPLL